jgi:AraC-like DNA-binding protein
MAEAAFLLETSDEPIARIASRVGYETAAAFSKLGHLEERDAQKHLLCCLLALSDLVWSVPEVCSLAHSVVALLCSNTSAIEA